MERVKLAVFEYDSNQTWTTSVLVGVYNVSFGERIFVNNVIPMIICYNVIVNRTQSLLKMLFDTF